MRVLILLGLMVLAGCARPYQPVQYRAAPTSAAASAPVRPAASTSTSTEVWDNETERQFVLEGYAVTSLFGCEAISANEAARVLVRMDDDARYAAISSGRKALLSAHARRMGLRSGPHCSDAAIKMTAWLMNRYGVSLASATRPSVRPTPAGPKAAPANTDPGDTGWQVVPDAPPPPLPAPPEQIDL